MVRAPGMLPAEALDDLIAKARALDMEEVRRQVAEEDERQEAAPQHERSER